MGERISPAKVCVEGCIYIREVAEWQSGQIGGVREKLLPCTLGDLYGSAIDFQVLLYARSLEDLSRRIILNQNLTSFDSRKHAWRVS